MKRTIYQGLYVLDFNTYIKIGRSSNLHKRITSYEGSSEKVKQLLVIHTKDHVFLEKKSHSFASQYLARQGRREKFICPTENDKQEFLLKYKQFLNSQFPNMIDAIIEEFETDPVKIIHPMKTSNLPGVGGNSQQKTPLLKNKLFSSSNTSCSQRYPTESIGQERFSAVDTKQSSPVVEDVIFKGNTLQDFKDIIYNPQKNDGFPLNIHSESSFNHKTPQYSNLLLENKSQFDIVPQFAFNQKSIVVLPKEKKMSFEEEETKEETKSPIDRFNLNQSHIKQTITNNIRTKKKQDKYTNIEYTNTDKQKMLQKPITKQTISDLSEYVYYEPKKTATLNFKVYQADNGGSIDVNESIIVVKNSSNQSNNNKSQH